MNPNTDERSYRAGVVDASVGMLEMLADRFTNGEAAVRDMIRLNCETTEEERYLQGCADTYKNLSRNLRDEVARYREQNI